MRARLMKNLGGIHCRKKIRRNTVWEGNMSTKFLHDVASSRRILENQWDCCYRGQNIGDWT